MKRFLVALVGFGLFALLTTRLFAQTDITSLSSPSLLATGGTTVGSISPYANLLNPAASGGVQRAIFDVNYVGLAGVGPVSGLGNLFNGALTVPTPVGVFSGSARYIGSSLAAYDFGSVGMFNLSFSKDIYSNLYVGAGLDFAIGGGGAWGLGLNLGFLDSPGDLWILKDFRWGAALRNIGKGYPATPGAMSGLATTPPAFTPALGASFNLVKTTGLTWGLTPDVSFPSLQDVRLTMGTDLLFRDFLRIDASYVVDLADIQASRARTIPFSVGVTVNLRTDIKKDVKFLGITKNGWNTSTIAVSSGIAPLVNGIWAGGLGGTLTLGKRDTTPPVIVIDPPPYISPNGDGTLDNLPVSLKITDQRYIEGYKLVIENEQSQTVRTIGESYTGPASTGVKNFFDRIFSVKRSIEVPDKIVWDGKNEQGTVVPDGTYHYFVEAWDDNGNLGKSKVETVVVDDTPPSVEVSAPYREFSPNGDGKKDILIIDQSGSSEDVWKGAFLNANGRAVRHVDWSTSRPTGFTWDGKDDNGAALPDGVYAYRVTSTDRAGNTGSAELSNVVLNTQATPVNLTLSRTAFSPNGDGVKDNISFSLEVPVKNGIERWSLVVKNSSTNPVRSFTGTSEVPTSITFDGRTDSGKILAEGEYTTTLAVWYANGNNPVTESPPFTVDLTPPVVDVTAPYGEFSPNGDGNKDVLPIVQRGSREGLWRGEIVDSSGSAVRTVTWANEAPASFQWDGRDQNGKLVADGAYAYRITSTDAAGNTGSGSLRNIVVNTQPTPVTLTIDLSDFSPNGDGVKDSINFGLDVGVKRGIEEWSLDIKDSGGAVRRSFSGRNEIPPTIAFDGKDDTGEVLAEGTYGGTLSVRYVNGNNPVAASPPFMVDLTPPSASVTADYSVFSPNGDGNKDFITFTQTTSEEQAWKGIVKDSGGAGVRTITWRGKAEARFAWDGHGDDGRPLPDGRYTYVLESTDKAGNFGKSAPVAFEINTAETPVLISTDMSSFSPNNDGIKDTLRMLPTLKVTTGVDSYRIAILDKAGRKVREFQGSGSVPKEIAWNGRDDRGGVVADGEYTAELDVLYRNGNHPNARSNPFAVDTVQPTIVVSASDRLFSPDGDGRLDTTTIGQSSSDEKLWEGDFVAKDGAVVRSYFWKGKTTNFTWDGKDDNGNVVPDGTYSYVIKSTDGAGNQTIKRIDGLVVDTRPTPVSIGVSSDGLSPNGDGARDSIVFSPSVGLQSGIKSWRVDMVNDHAGIQKTFAGSGSVPGSLTWNGTTDIGNTAAEGSYQARLTVDYLKGNLPQATSGSFLLSVTPPKVGVSLAPLPFSPDGDGVNDSLTISLTATDPSPIVDWNATIVDPMGHFFRRFEGSGMPPESITWNGLSADGELVQAAEDYPLTVTVRDELGNVGKLTESIPIDVLVIREGNKLKVRISSITFAPDTADYLQVPTDRKERNLKTLERLAEIFKKYGQYDIRIEGYAVMVYYNDPQRGKLEQEQVLIPLSKARADSIKNALVSLGLSSNRITTVGLGGADPIVPFSDLENRWKDRRVEFILIRKPGGG